MDSCRICMHTNAILRTGSTISFFVCIRIAYAYGFLFPIQTVYRVGSVSCSAEVKTFLHFFPILTPPDGEQKKQQWRNSDLFIHQTNSG